MLLLFTDIADLGFGGIQKVNQLFMAAAQKAALPAVVVTRRDAPDTPHLRGWAGSYGAGGSPPKFVAAALRRQAHARNSVILATHIGLAPLARAIQKLSDGRFFMFLHGVEAWGPLPRATRWGLQTCDAFIANSQFTLDKFRATHPAFAGFKSALCALPAQLTPADDTPRKRELRVLTVGRLWGRGMRKGQKQIIELWPRIVAEFQAAEYWIVGGGEGRAELEALAEKHGVAQSVKFTGAISDEELSELYRTSAVYAMPSWGEGFGIVFADAQAHGLPCIASRHDAGREVVADGVTGLHADPEQPAEIYQILRQLLSDEDLRQRYGAAAQVRAAQLFALPVFQARAAQIMRGEI